MSLGEVLTVLRYIVSVSMQTRPYFVFQVIMGLFTFFQQKMRKRINNLVLHLPVFCQSISAQNGVFPSFKFPVDHFVYVPLDQNLTQLLWFVQMAATTGFCLILKESAQERYMLNFWK